ncbi:MAG: hypothetical protein M1834_003312 [Cirrosporium novae-zelandiae]|nr:MAG: hypothetical protein M1834_003312 [Cirrosporium novae-zelandiae]
MVHLSTLTNCRLCINGDFVRRDLCFSKLTGCFVPCSDHSLNDETLDMKNAIIAPGFLELQTNGLLGFHFTNFNDEGTYLNSLETISKYFVSTGVTGFWTTLPTVSSERFQRILPHLKPRSFPGGADLLGAHVEGPYLAQVKKGAHEPHLFCSSKDFTPENVYGLENLKSVVKFITVAPEIPGAKELINHLSTNYDIIVSMGHSASTYEEGLDAIKAGARALTHVFNAMNPLHHRHPGLTGLVTSSSVYYSIIADGIHLHPATVSLAFRANPARCILITDSIELSGLPDGVYPGNEQIKYRQQKMGNRVTIDGTDTLIGSCSTLDDCVRNLMEFSGCTLAQAVSCVGENIVNLMKDMNRGKLEDGRRADFVVLDDNGVVLQTWMQGTKVYDNWN